MYYNYIWIENLFSGILSAIILLCRSLIEASLYWRLCFIIDYNYKISCIFLITNGSYQDRAYSEIVQTTEWPACNHPNNNLNAISWVEHNQQISDNSSRYPTSPAWRKLWRVRISIRAAVATWTKLTLWSVRSMLKICFTYHWYQSICTIITVVTIMRMTA